MLYLFLKSLQCSLTYFFFIKKYLREIFFSLAILKWSSSLQQQTWMNLSVSASLCIYMHKEALYILYEVIWLLFYARMRVSVCMRECVLVWWRWDSLSAAVLPLGREPRSTTMPSRQTLSSPPATTDPLFSVCSTRLSWTFSTRGGDVEGEERKRVICREARW